MKKNFIRTFCLVASVFLSGLGFCGAASAEEITIVGTGSGMPLLKAVGKKFSEIAPGITVVVPPSIGSSGGIKTVGRDNAKIGRVARPIKEKERFYGLTYTPFAKMPIVFFTHKDIQIKDLTPKQLCDIYAGKIRNWKILGGKDMRIRVIRREDGDSSLKVLLSALEGFKDIEITTRSKTTFNDQETLDTAEKTTGAIAFGTYVNAIKYDLNVLSVADKKPVESDYPYNGTLALIYKKANYTGNIKKFVDFAISSEANNVILSAGGLPY